MSANRSSIPIFQDLQDIRQLLLKLHKALMEAEKIGYEQTHGPIKNRGEYFQLVLSHDRFSWLRPISQFIVQIDEVLMSKQPQSVEVAQDLLQQAQALISTSETGQTLAQRYPTVVALNTQIGPLYSRIRERLNA